MNLDSLSFALIHINNLVTSLTKKNYKSSCQEIVQVIMSCFVLFFPLLYPRLTICLLCNLAGLGKGNFFQSSMRSSNMGCHVHLVKSLSECPTGKNTCFHQHVRHKSAFAAKFSVGVWCKWMFVPKKLWCKWMKKGQEKGQTSQEGGKISKVGIKVNKMHFLRLKKCPAS